MRVSRVALPAILMALLCVASVGADKLSADQLVAKHLDSIGTAELRSKVMNREINGKVLMNIIAGGSGQMEGTLLMFSAGEKTNTLMKFPNPNYQKEEFLFDGDKVVVGQIRPGVRSKLGTLLEAQTQLVKEGLLGGALTTAWPLLNLKEKHPKLSSDGLKKIDGRELYQMTYAPKKGGGDVNVKMYFDPTNFHHVMTIYTLSYGPRLSQSGELASASQTETRIRLEERFDEFKDMNGLTLPTKWTMKLTSEGGVSEGGAVVSPVQSSMLEWQMALQKFSVNTEAPPIEGW